MKTTLYHLLKHDVARMVRGLATEDTGNIYPLIVEQVEKYVIELVLKETNYNCLRTAKMLGVSRSTLYRKAELFGISLHAETLPSASSH